MNSFRGVFVASFSSLPAPPSTCCSLLCSCPYSPAHSVERSLIAAIPLTQVALAPSRHAVLLRVVCSHLCLLPSAQRPCPN